MCGEELILGGTQHYKFRSLSNYLSEVNMKSYSQPNLLSKNRLFNKKNYTEWDSIYMFFFFNNMHQ